MEDERRKRRKRYERRTLGFVRKGDRRGRKKEGGETTFNLNVVSSGVENEFTTRSPTSFRFHKST